MHTSICTYINTHERKKCTITPPPKPLAMQLVLPPPALRLSTRRTNPNPSSPHQQTSLLPRVLFPPNRSTAPLPSLSHSFTNLRFSLAPTLSRLSIAFSLALGPGIEPRRSAGVRRPTAATLADTIGETPLPSGPAPANSRPSSGNFPSRRWRRLSGNRLLLAI
jgi:hypothetical protein